MAHGAIPNKTQLRRPKELSPGDMTSSQINTSPRCRDVTALSRRHRRELPHNPLRERASMEGGVEGRSRCLSAIQSNVDDDTCVTFVLNGEDHTLGNPLRYMVMKNPDVDFCGYSVTHPSEDKINFRIQTRGIPAVDTFRRGLCELTAVCEHILATFEASVNTYNTSHGIAGPMDES